METRTYILKLQTDMREAGNEAILEQTLDEEVGRNIVAYSFKMVEIPKLDEDK